MTEAGNFRTAVLETFENLNRFSRGGVRAPHKPVLLLHALSKLYRRDESPITIAEAEEVIEKRFRALFPTTAFDKFYEPFWRLRKEKWSENKAIWIVSPDDIRENQSGSPSLCDLREKNATGRLHPRIVETCLKDREFLDALAGTVLFDLFGDSLLEDVEQIFGLQLGKVELPERDPRFREIVLDAYKFKCCICGFNLRLRDRTFGLEAAHIMMHSRGGPSTVNNGLSLCANHHKLFDIGAFSLNDDFRLVLSPLVDPDNTAETLYLNPFGDLQITLPNLTTDFPAMEYLAWHRKNIFLKPGGTSPSSLQQSPPHFGPRRQIVCPHLLAAPSKISKPEDPGRI